MQRRDFLVLASLAWWICLSAAARAATSDPMYAKWHVPAEFELFQPQEIKPHWAKRLTGYLKTRDGTELRYGGDVPNRNGEQPAGAFPKRRECNRMSAMRTPRRGG